MSTPDSEPSLPSGAASEPKPSAPVGGARATPPAAKTKGEIPWRLIVSAAVLVYAVIFVIINADQVEVNFVFFSTRVSLVVALVLALLIGVLAGYLIEAGRERRARKKKAS